MNCNVISKLWHNLLLNHCDPTTTCGSPYIHYIYQVTTILSWQYPLVITAYFSFISVYIQSTYNLSDCNGYRVFAFSSDGQANRVRGLGNALCRWVSPLTQWSMSLYMAVVSCELKKVEGDRKWCACTRVCVCVRGGRRGAEEGGSLMLLSCHFSSLTKTPSATEPFAASRVGRAFGTPRSPWCHLYTARGLLLTLYTQRHAHTIPGPEKASARFPDIPVRARPVSLADTLFRVGTFLTHKIKWRIQGRW